MKFAILAIGVFAFSSCGTIVNGRRQEVAVTSTPTGAHCEADGKKFDTPAVVKMKRRHGHTIMCELDGRKGGAALSRHGSGWVFGNIMLGGPIGLLVDWASGGLYRLSPDQVIVAMGEAPKTTEAK